MGLALCHGTILAMTRMPDRFVLTPFYVGEGGGPCPEESVVLDMR